MTWPTDRDIAAWQRAERALDLAATRVLALSPTARAFFATELADAVARLQRAAIAKNDAPPRHAITAAEARQ